ncbi:MAG: hypothetical protein IPJ77_05970 [Planctomycetes bacterium]|nr:hypothetical protein [Planctomycetota bacterium]
MRTLESQRETRGRPLRRQIEKLEREIATLEPSSRAVADLRRQRDSTCHELSQLDAVCYAGMDRSAFPDGRWIVDFTADVDLAALAKRGLHPGFRTTGDGLEPFHELEALERMVEQVRAPLQGGARTLAEKRWREAFLAASERALLYATGRDWTLADKEVAQLHRLLQEAVVDLTALREVDLTTNAGLELFLADRKPERVARLWLSSLRSRQSSALPASTPEDLLSALAKAEREGDFTTFARALHLEGSEGERWALAIVLVQLRRHLNDLAASEIEARSTPEAALLSAVRAARAQRPDLLGRAVVRTDPSGFVMPDVPLPAGFLLATKRTPAGWRIVPGSIDERDRMPGKALPEMLADLAYWGRVLVEVRSADSASVLDEARLVKRAVQAQTEVLERASRR